MKTSEKKETGDFLFFVERIKEKTDIDTTVFSDRGVSVAGGMPGEILKDCTENIRSDQNYTYFPIKYRNKNYIGRIGVGGETGKKFACLIGELAENFFSKDADLSVNGFYKAIIFGELNYSKIIPVPTVKTYNLIKNEFEQINYNSDGTINTVSVPDLIVPGNTDVECLKSVFSILSLFLTSNQLISVMVREDK